MKYPIVILAGIIILVGCDAKDSPAELISSDSSKEISTKYAPSEAILSGEMKTYTNEELGITAQYPVEWNGMDFGNGEFSMIEDRPFNADSPSVNNKVTLRYQSNPLDHDERLVSFINRKIRVDGKVSDYEVFTFPEDILNDMEVSEPQIYKISKDFVSIRITPHAPLSHISIHYTGNREGSNVLDAFVDSIEIAQ